MSSVELIDQPVSIAGSSAFLTAAIPKTRERFEIVTSFLERVADLAAVMAAAVLACATYELLQIGKNLHYSAGTVLLAAFGFGVVFVLMLDHDGAYKRANSLLRIRETERILRVSTQAFALVFALTFFFSQRFSRWIVALAVVLVPLLLIAEKQFMFLLIRNLHKRGHGLPNPLGCR